MARHKRAALEVLKVGSFTLHRIGGVFDAPGRLIQAAWVVVPVVDTTSALRANYTECSDAEVSRKCAYCGSTVREPTCPHCGAPE